MLKDSNYKYRLSIIVAIYNVEAYLERCVSSLVKQDLPPEDYEILLVNDGSTDKSLEIAQRFEKEYTNVTVYSKENGGLSSVRNFGIDHAQGRYIMHVDGDDFLVEDVIKKVVETAEENDLDLCFFGFIKYPNNQHVDMFRKFKHLKVFSGEYLLLNDMRVSSTWCCIYRLAFLKERAIKYFGRISHQDVEFNYRLYPFAKRVMFTDFFVYYYSSEGESITRTNNIKKKERNQMDNLQIAHNVKAFVNGGGCSDKIRKYLNRKMNSMVIALLYSFLNKSCEFGYPFVKSFIDEAKKLKVYPILGRSSSWKTTALLPLINIRPLFLFLVKLNKTRNKE